MTRRPAGRTLGDGSWVAGTGSTTIQTDERRTRRSRKGAIAMNSLRFAARPLAVAARVNVDRGMTNPIETLAEFLGRLPGRFTDLLGIQVEQAGAERTVLTMECRPELTMPYGVMHGGAVAALADSAAGIAMMASLRPGEAFATAEMKLNLLGAVREGTLTAEASAIHRGRRTAVYEVKVTDGRGRLIGLFLCTQMILEQQRPPSGRQAASPSESSEPQPS
jgi:1,4-dihydroxy-2-naphthoyl-CoA hydrolase